MKCDNCLENQADMHSSMDCWSKIYQTIDILETEETITPQTAENIRNLLQWIKLPCIEDDELKT